MSYNYIGRNWIQDSRILVLTVEMPVSQPLCGTGTKVFARFHAPSAVLKASTKGSVGLRVAASESRNIWKFDENGGLRSLTSQSPDTRTANSEPSSKTQSYSLVQQMGLCCSVTCHISSRATAVPSAHLARFAQNLIRTAIFLLWRRQSANKGLHRWYSLIINH